MLSDTKVEMFAEIGLVPSLYPLEGKTGDEVKQLCGYQKRPKGDGPFTIWVLDLKQIGVPLNWRADLGIWEVPYRYYAKSLSEVVDRAMEHHGILNRQPRQKKAAEASAT